MKFSACACDCCGILMQEGKSKSFEATLSGIKIKEDLCTSCADNLMVYFNKLFTATVESALNKANESK